MSAPTPSPVAAEIAKIKERAEAARHHHVPCGAECASQADIPPLVAAIEAVLALAHTGPIYVRDEPVYDWTLDPAAIREAIESALRATQGGEGQ